jgi:tRNA-dihydrouridine synthase B
MNIGSITLENNLFVAPMAGVTDRPFRTLCKKLGAGYAVSEMVTSKRELWNSLKTSRRADHTGESGPIAVQIAGTDPTEMADAARYNMDRGAQIIDINMGCPAKKVCQKWAGSALMQDEKLALEIIEAVVAACAPRHVPVTLKMRTGWCQQVRNAPVIAQAAQNAGVAMLTVHGRTREQGYHEQAEYDTIAQIKAAVSIPVVANGDIDSPAKARFVLEKTKADALMVGRAAQGRPWIFREISHFLETGHLLPAPATLDICQWMTEHLHEHYALYGEHTGVRSARKHIGWLVHRLPGGQAFRQTLNPLESTQAQVSALQSYLTGLAQTYPLWPDSTAHKATELSATSSTGHDSTMISRLAA